MKPRLQLRQQCGGSVPWKKMPLPSKMLHVLPLLLYFVLDLIFYSDLASTEDESSFKKTCAWFLGLKIGGGFYH